MTNGLYMSAAGVMANAYRQDVIANNIANSETTGFKRDLAFFQARKTEAQSRGAGGAGSPSAIPSFGEVGIGPTNATLEGIGGGTLLTPTGSDFSQGDVETTDNPHDLAIVGSGYFAVESNGKQYLTRAGHLTVNSAGDLILANGRNDKILDANLHPITVDPRARFSVDSAGTISLDAKPFAKLALLDVPDSHELTKQGGDLFAHADLTALRPASGEVVPSALERSNVDPTVELSHLMETQRALEANANMIRYQDSTLSRLVNDVGKIS